MAGVRGDRVDGAGENYYALGDRGPPSQEVGSQDPPRYPPPPPPPASSYSTSDTSSYSSNYPSGYPSNYPPTYPSPYLPAVPSLPSQAAPPLGFRPPPPPMPLGARPPPPPLPSHIRPPTKSSPPNTAPPDERQSVDSSKNLTRDAGTTKGPSKSRWDERKNEKEEGRKAGKVSGGGGMKITMGLGKRPGSAAVSMKLKPQLEASKKPKLEPSSQVKSASSLVARAFGSDSEDEEEEMPPAAKLRMRNLGRDTPTSSGPNSFYKTAKGFTDPRGSWRNELDND